MSGTAGLNHPFQLFLVTNSLPSVRKKIHFTSCNCTPDAVRLLRMGYMAASPKSPRTAYSMRLMRWHHIMWSHCSNALMPFAEAVDKYLDAANPLILVAQTQQVNTICETLSSKLHNEFLVF